MKSSLSKHLPRPKTPEWELEEFRRRAWKFDETLCVKVSALTDDWERQVLINIGNRMYGERVK